jgi:diadenosine tetraphosphatase ApaH/serine/threonine PP2A family protein phosphatase
MRAGDLVAEEADAAGGGEPPQMRQLLWIDEALDRLDECDAGAGEDREHDGDACQALAAHTAEEEGEAKRDRGGGVAEVVDQVGEQRHAQRARIDHGLHQRRSPSGRRG